MFSKAMACATLATACVGASIPEPKLVGPWVEQSSYAHTEGAEMPISIVLPSANTDRLAKIVEQVSTPGHSSYGQYLSVDEVEKLTRPASEHVDAVVGWLLEQGVDSHVKGSNVHFNANPAKVESLFQTRIRYVVNKETGVAKLRANGYTIPVHLEDKVATVFGLHGLPLPPRKATLGGAPANVNPATINRKYNVTGVEVKRTLTNRQAVVEFQGQNGEQKDLTKFFKQQVEANAYQQGDELIYKIIGSDGRRSGTEAALDIQYIMGVSPGIKTEFWGYPGFDFCKDMNDFTSQAVANKDSPNVFSISYGYQGPLRELGCEDADTHTTEVNLMKMAAQGISILVSSGDSGSQYTHQHLFPSWPASSPYVTAVGGTRFVDQDVNKDEMATDQFGSGGGFSFHFDRTNAQWQEADVTGYLTYVESPTSNVTHRPVLDSYQGDGRGTPDMSGIAEGYAVYSGGFLQRVGGTSASAPMFAGLISLLNEAREQNGKGPLGLLNAWLYQNPDAFTDVTKGTGAVSRSGGNMEQGWDCTPGWDAATGLGTPKFDKLLVAALKV